MLRTREQVRVLGPGDRDGFVALAEQDPVVNVFADYRARLTNLDERWLGGQVWGRFEGDELVAGCHLGANLVPVQCTPDDVGAFADAALRRRNSVGTIVGPSDVVAALWELVEPRWARPREVRSQQPHLQIDRIPTIGRRPRTYASPPRRTSTALYPACVAMYTEEVGVSPENDAGGGDLYRARIQQLIGRGWSMASFDDAGRRLQGRGRLRDAVRRPGAGRVGPARPPGRGARGRAAWLPWSPTSSAPAWRPWSRSTSTSGTRPPGRRTRGSVSSRPRPSRR